MFVEAMVILEFLSKSKIIEVSQLVFVEEEYAAQAQKSRGLAGQPIQIRVRSNKLQPYAVLPLSKF